MTIWFSYTIWQIQIKAITHVAIYVSSSQQSLLKSNKILCCVHVYFDILACSFRIQHATNALLQKKNSMENFRASADASCSRGPWDCSWEAEIAALHSHSNIPHTERGSQHKWSLLSSLFIWASRVMSHKTQSIIPAPVNTRQLKSD